MKTLLQYHCTSKGRSCVANSTERSQTMGGPRQNGSYIVEGSQLAILASDHHIIDISNGAGKVVARIGCLPGMPYHLRGAKPG